MINFPQIKTDELFDSHAHISSPEFAHCIPEILNSANSMGVTKIFDMSVDIESCTNSINLSKSNFEKIYSFVGIDPEVFILGSPLYLELNGNDLWFEERYTQLDELINNNLKFIAGIGETGLDFHHNQISFSEGKINQNDITKSNIQQEKLFQIHLELAQKFKLPLSIHSRKAEKYCTQIVKKYNAQGIFHSFTGDFETAKLILDLGWGLGVNGITTFKNSGELRDVYRKILGKIPSNVTPDYFYKRGIYFETDSPFLSPDGKRGERNEPANIKIIYENFCRVTFA